MRRSIGADGVAVVFAQGLFAWQKTLERPPWSPWRAGYRQTLQFGGGSGHSGFLQTTIGSRERDSKVAKGEIGQKPWPASKGIGPWQLQCSASGRSPKRISGIGGGFEGVTDEHHVFPFVHEDGA